MYKQLRLLCVLDFMQRTVAVLLLWQLYNKLNISELRQFANLVKAWHVSMPFSEFCEQVLELYGPDRKHLILGTFSRFCAAQDKWLVAVTM